MLAPTYTTSATTLLAKREDPVNIFLQ